MLSKILTIPFAVAALVFLYLAWEVNADYSIYLVPCFIAFVVLYLLSPQINWWWYKRHPPDVPAGLRHLLETHIHFYRKFSEPEKARFRNRMAMYIEGNEFMPQGMESVPVDVKGAVAASAVQMTFGLEKFLFPKFEHLIIYPHPFPSPQYPEKWHASEIYEEDGVVMFSAEQLMAGFFQPTRYFNIGLYEFARIFMRSYPKLPYPAFGENSWDRLQQISGFTRDFIEKWIGLPGVEPAAVAIAHFFVFPEKFKAVMPEEFEALSEIFKTPVRR